MYSGAVKHRIAGGEPSLPSGIVNCSIAECDTLSRVWWACYDLLGLLSIV